MARPELYTLSLHDALPIWHRQNERGKHVEVIEGHRQVEEVRGERPDEGGGQALRERPQPGGCRIAGQGESAADRDRKSTRLNSSHVSISYAVFCLKKKRRG